MDKVTLVNLSYKTTRQIHTQFFCKKVLIVLKNFILYSETPYWTRPKFEHIKGQITRGANAFKKIVQH